MDLSHVAIFALCISVWWIGSCIEVAVALKHMAQVQSSGQGHSAAQKSVFVTHKWLDQHDMNNRCVYYFEILADIYIHFREIHVQIVHHICDIYI